MDPSEMGHICSSSQGEGGEPEVEAPWGVQVNVFLATEGKLRRVVKKPDVGGGTV